MHTLHCLFMVMYAVLQNNQLVCTAALGTQDSQLWQQISAVVGPDSIALLC
jgi:hypothetical protein